jgi:hypothetical protein
LGYNNEHVCQDFDLQLGGPWWREHGLTSEEICAFLKDKAIPYHCFVDEHHIWTPAEPQGPRVAWTIHDGHAYFYRNGGCLQKWRPTCNGESSLRGEHEGEMQALEEWLPWDGELCPGYFHCSNLQEVRKELLKQGKCPKVSLKSLCSWGALRYRCTLGGEGRSGWCVIRELPDGWEVLRDWASELGVEYTGQGLPAVTLEVFQTLLKGKRRQPTRLEKREILMRQDQKCALCGCEATLEFDHLGPVRQLVHGQPQIFRAICRPCHQEVTAAQGGCPRLESRFSPRAWKEYVCTARAPPLVWQPEKAGTEDLVNCEIDVIRCRRNALMYPAV